VTSPRSNLERLFHPTSVAVVGASASPEKAGYQALTALGSFPGEVFAINPKAQAILGQRTLPSLSALGRPVDLVLFAVPAAACASALRDAIQCGCGGGVVVSGGFAESGPEGARIQAELATLCAGSGFRLLGPNTAGFVNKVASLTATFLPSADRIPRGEIAVVAQSAGINLTVTFLLAKHGYGVSHAVGLGNGIDISAADVLEFLAEQSETRAIALHLEGVAQGRRLYETLRRVTRKKPVAVLAVGREDVGEFARSHTGNLLGSHALRVSALRQAGAVLVASTEELAVAAAALSLHRLAPKAAAGIGIVTAQAGAGLVMLDSLKSSGVSVPELGAATVARVAAHLPPITYLKNPVDTSRPGPSFAEVLVAVAEDERIDAVIGYALSEPAALRPAEVLPAVARRAPKAVLFGTMGLSDELASTIEALRGQRIYVAESPEELATAARVLAHDAAGQARLARPESEARSFGAAWIPASPDEHAAKQLLESIGIPAPRRVACASHAAARDAFEQLQKPVAVKLLSPELLHKTEAGAVHLNVADGASLRALLARLDAIPLRGQRRYLIEEMAPPGLEMIVSAVRDESFGPTVMVGLGGTFAEAFGDTAVRLAPLGVGQAEDMIEELRAASLLQGWRGGSKLDRESLAHALVKLGNLLCTSQTVSLLEINPLRVYDQGILALDAVLIVDVD